MPMTPRLGLPLLTAGQSQKDVTHNDAVLALDRLVALVVVSRGATTPPAVPAAGDVFIVPSQGSSAWELPAGTLAHWQGSGWLGEPPRDGQLALVADEGLMVVHRSGWQDAWPVASLNVGGRAVLAVSPATVTAPDGGSTIDVQARAAIAELVIALQQQGLLADAG
jgi:hypothetical protein